MQQKNTIMGYGAKVGMLWGSLFVLTFPFPFSLLPDVGSFFHSITIAVNRAWAQVLGLGPEAILLVESDTIGLYLHVLSLLLLSFGLAGIWQKVYPSHVEVWTWVYTGIAYYLGLILVIYGMNKLMGRQFPFPGANLLYTPLGKLSPDILYWTSMASSPIYYSFAGLIELLPAALLFFSRTRWLGGLIAVGVLLNVWVINLGFDISVKVFSTVLLGLSLVIVWPGLSAFNTFLGAHAAILRLPKINNPSPRKGKEGYLLLKSFILTFIVLEGVSPYVVGGEREQISTLHELAGAYQVIRHGSGMLTSQANRIHVHKEGYLYFEMPNSDQLRFDLVLPTLTHQMLLKQGESGAEMVLEYQLIQDTLSLKGTFDGVGEDAIQAIKIDLEEIPFRPLNPHWTIEAKVASEQE